MISEFQNVLLIHPLTLPLSNSYKCSFVRSQSLTIATFYDNSSTYSLKEQVCTDTMFMTTLATLITRHNFICIVTSSHCGILFNCITIIRKNTFLSNKSGFEHCNIL